jgi:radical SAM protein with 4Fe4S-binding SPASM domain
MAHEVRVFEQFMNKTEHNETIPKTCIIPFLHCVIEADGSVFPCCDVMNENAEFEKVNFNYSLGNLKDFDYDFYQLWHSEKANKIKNFLLNNRVTECATCPARYYSCNIEYEKESERVMFL